MALGDDYLNTTFAMRFRTIPFAVLVFGVFAFACVRPSLDELPVSEHAGHYTFGASSSWFWACGAAAADSSWVTFTDRAVAQRDSIQRTGALSAGERYFVRWRAAVTSSGEVGPRGSGVPALLVREILVLRPAAAGDCR